MVVHQIVGRRIIRALVVAIMADYRCYVTLKMRQVDSPGWLNNLKIGTSLHEMSTPVLSKAG